MENNINLYQLTTSSGRFSDIRGTFYVVAGDPTTAQDVLMGMLKEADYGAGQYKKVIAINLLAEGVKKAADGAPRFCLDDNSALFDDNKLIIASDRQ